MQSGGTRWFSGLIGLVVGVLLTGLLLPFVVGDGGGEAAGGTDFSVEENAAGDLGDTAVGAGGGSGAAADDIPGAADDAAAGGPEGGGTTGPSAAGGGETGRGEQPEAGGADRTATDVGVTAESIKLGFLLLDVGSIGRIGVGVPGVDPAQQRAAFEAFMKDINDRGGIHGRKLVGAYRNFDVLSEDDQRRACLAITQDDEAFAVIAAGGFGGPPVLCVTNENKTPLINSGSIGTPTEYVRRSNGLLFTPYADSNRVMANWANELDRRGHLEGKKVGIVTSERFDAGKTIIEGALVPALRQLGHDVVHVTRLTGDEASGSGQIPVQVQQMRTAGAEIVLLAVSTLHSTQFVQQADSQGYRPRYSVTDWASMANDVSNNQMPPSYDGAIGITVYRTGEDKVGMGETPEMKECRSIYEKGTGRRLDAYGSNEHGITNAHCTLVKIFEAGAKAAGPALTRAALSRGIQSVGTVPMTMWGGGGYRPGKFGAADLIREMRWKGACRCWHAAGPFQPSRF